MSDKSVGDELMGRLKKFVEQAESSSQQDELETASCGKCGANWTVVCYRTSLREGDISCRNCGTIMVGKYGTLGEMVRSWNQYQSDAPTTRPAQMDSVCGKPKPDSDREPKTTPFAKPVETPVQVKR